MTWLKVVPQNDLVNGGTSGWHGVRERGLDAPHSGDGEDIRVI